MLVLAAEQTSWPDVAFYAVVFAFFGFIFWVSMR